MKALPKKRYLIQPEGVFPLDWPTVWEFPSSICPPGYPKARPEKLYLDASYDNGVMSVRVLNEFCEEVDELNGYFLQVYGLAGGKVVRMRANSSSKWFEAGVFLIKDGVSTELHFETERVNEHQYFIIVGLYGYDEGFGTAIEVKNACVPS
jgi:hypothetical protein